MNYTDQDGSMPGEDIPFFKKNNNAFEHRDELVVTIVTKVILGRTNSMKWQHGTLGRAHSQLGKIRKVTTCNHKRMKEIKTQTCLKWHKRLAMSRFCFLNVLFLQNRHISRKEPQRLKNKGPKCFLEFVLIQQSTRGIGRKATGECQKPLTMLLAKCGITALS